MSCIAARISKNKIEIAGDNQTSWGSYMKYPKKTVNDRDVKEFGKLWQVDDFTFGCAGSCSHIGLLQIFVKTHRPKEMNRDSVLDWLLEFKDWALAKAKVPFNDVSVHGIIIYDRVAFTFFDHLEVYPILTFDAVGSGMNLAIGAMELGATAKRAVGIAVKYDPFCSGKVSSIII